MTNFNIENSKIEQLNESGNNYKISGSGSNTISEQGNVVQVDGDANKVAVDKPKDGFSGGVWRRITSAWKWITCSS